jgi:hypothetical protein
MTNKLRITGIAAIMNALISIATLIVAFGFIGINALADRSRFIQLALTNPTPIIVQDVLKFMAAIISFVLVTTLFAYLKHTKTVILRIATSSGILSILFLLVNGALSLYAVTQLTDDNLNRAASGEQLNVAMSILGLLAIMCNGIWYIGIHWLSLQTQALPKKLCYLGLCIGAISLLPPLAPLVLVLSIIWSIWLGQVFLRKADRDN